MHLVPEGKVCSTILKLYNEEAIVVEPAGALSIAALDDYAEQIRGRKIVCIVSGSKEFVNIVLGPTDDITRFEYMQKTNKEAGPALVGIELQSQNDYDALLRRMDEQGIRFTEINKDDKLYGYLI